MAAAEARYGVAPVEGEADEEDVARPRRREEGIRPRGQDQSMNQSALNSSPVLSGMLAPQSHERSG